MVNTIILKGYEGNREVWAISKKYGEGETATNFICEIMPDALIKKEYERQKNVYNNTRKKIRIFSRNSAK